MLGIPDEKIADLDGDNYRTSPHFTEGEKALLDLAVQIRIDANRIPKDLWQRVHAHWTEPQIGDAVFVVTIYIAVSKFCDALGVALEPMFDGVQPKRMLLERGLSFVEHDVSQPEALAAYRARLPRERALPQIFVGGEHVGGLEDLRLRLA